MNEKTNNERRTAVVMRKLQSAETFEQVPEGEFFACSGSIFRKIPRVKLDNEAGTVFNAACVVENQDASNPILRGFVKSTAVQFVSRLDVAAEF